MNNTNNVQEIDQLMSLATEVLDGTVSTPRVDLMRYLYQGDERKSTTIFHLEKKSGLNLSENQLIKLARQLQMEGALLLLGGEGPLSICSITNRFMMAIEAEQIKSERTLARQVVTHDPSDEYSEEIALLRFLYIHRERPATIHDIALGFGLKDERESLFRNLVKDLQRRQVLAHIVFAGHQLYSIRPSFISLMEGISMMHDKSLQQLNTFYSKGM